jgi:hypothetical protein
LIDQVYSTTNVEGSADTMIEPQTVYLAMIGGFEDRYVGGVFYTREAAEAYLTEYGGQTYGDLGCLDFVAECDVQGAPSPAAASGAVTPVP